MRGSTLKVVEGDVTFYVDDPRDSAGLTATVSVVIEEAGEQGGITRIVHRDRISLAKVKDREKFAQAAGIDPDTLIGVYDRVFDYLNPLPPPAAEPASDEPDPAIRAEALTLLEDSGLLGGVHATLAALGYAGDATQPALVYLALTSRLLARPINLVVSGPSASGKSFLTSLVARLFPATATYPLSGMSERVLVYTDADLRHRTLIVGEASALHRDGIGASLLRSIAWEGNVVYETVEKTPEGLKPRRIEKPGPTGFVTTTTRGVEAELATRVLTIHVSDDTTTTRTIMLATAARANGQCPDEPDLRPWHELQRWLAEEGDRGITIPFADRLGADYPAEPVRSRRDFTQLLGLLQASALLHQRQRQRDEAGRIVASERDYEIVFDLAAPIFGALVAEGVTPAIRETVASVAELTREADAGTVSLSQLATALGRAKSVTSSRVGAAIRGGWLVNDETGKGKPARLRVGDPLPEDRPALPRPDIVFAVPSRTPEHPANSPETPHNHAELTVRDAPERPQNGQNGSGPGVLGVLEPFQPPLERSFPHNHAENGPEEGDRSSVLAGREEALLDDGSTGTRLPLGGDRSPLFDMPDANPSCRDCGAGIDAGETWCPDCDPRGR